MTNLIGITTTIPSEVVYAAGLIPVDLNNGFITSDQPSRYIEIAERAGFPRNICSWIKGIYAVALESPDIKSVIAVTQGDCSNTHALMEVLRYHGMEIVPFAFPYDRDYDMLRLQIEKLMERLGTDWEATLKAHKSMRSARRLLRELDEMTWKTGQVSGLDNHRWLIASSDFEGNVSDFTGRLERFVEERRNAPSREPRVRLGFMGIPPIFTDFYQYLESLDTDVVFNEIQRQFSMPCSADSRGPSAEAHVVEQYRRYTYPYDIFFRLEDVKKETAKRRVDGVIHYTQSFCFRQIQDLIVRKELGVPILTLEGDRPGPLDARTKIRLETFAEMLRERR